MKKSNFFRFFSLPSPNRYVWSFLLFLMVNYRCTVDDRSDRLDSMVSMSNFGEIENAVYACLKYEIYSPSTIQTFFKNKELADQFNMRLDSLINISSQMTMAEELDYLQSKDIISERVNKEYLALYEALYKSIQESPNLSEFFHILDNFQCRILDDNSIRYKEKELLLSFSAGIKGAFRYISEQYSLLSSLNNDNIVVSRGCFWERLGCIFKVSVPLAILMGFTSGAPGFVVGFFVGTTIGIVQEPANDCCTCCDQDCSPPSLISLDFADCSPTATIYPLGMGRVTLDWIIGAGTPASGYSGNVPHMLTVTQTNPAVPLTVTFLATCKDNGATPNDPATVSPTFSVNLFQEVLKVGPFWVDGPSDVFSSEEIYTYSVVGPATGDGRIVFDGFVVSSNGTVVSAGGNSVSVRWDMPVGEAGSVTATMRNTCFGGETKSSYLTVTRREDDGNSW